MRNREDRPRYRILIGLLCLFVVTGCTSAAAQRLKDASLVIAERIGTSADDVERTFKTRFSTLTELQLADEAEGTVQRTSWLDRTLARFAEDRLKTAKAVQRSTCRLIDSVALLSQLSDADGVDQVRSIIIDELQKQGLSDDEASIDAVAEGIVTQLESLQTTGSLDVQSMSSDMFCLFQL